MELAFLQDLREKIMDAQRQAAALVLHAGTVLAEIKTGQRDIVTEYDRKVQQLLVDRLSAAVPGAHFYLEESEQRDNMDSEHLFVIDPIDGTMNFVHHFSCSAISVAYLSRGELLCACVYNPYLDEMFSAIKGQGAFLNGQPIHVDPSHLNKTFFCLGSSPYRPELTDETFRLMRIAFDNSLDLRRTASAALDMCSVAAGRAGLYFELSIFLWDYLAGLLIAQEAGARFSAIDGSPLDIRAMRTSIAVGGPQAYNDFMALIEKERR